jgi:hypothetical protein
MLNARGLAVTVVAAVCLVAFVPVGASGANWTMSHLDIGRSGNNVNDPSLSDVAAAWTSPTLDGRVYGEPLVLGATAYVATIRNSVYALDLKDGHVIWSLTNIKTPVPLAAIQAVSGQFSNCGNIDPMGIVGTPVIDPSRGASGTLYAVAETWDGSNGATIEHQLLAIDLKTHAVTSTNVDPSGFTTGSKRALEQQRGAVALAGGRVAVPYGALVGDCGPYRGALVSANEDLTGVSTFTVDAAGSHVGGGIWGTGGAAADAGGNFYVTTGNGNEPQNAYDNTDGVIKLNPTMTRVDYFAPAEWFADNTADYDLGSMSPIMIPRTGSPLVFATGKQHTGFLLNSANLGGIGHELFRAHVCDGEAKGAAAYAAPYLYVPCGEGIRALSVNTSEPSFARAWQGPRDADGPPIVAGGLVWTHGVGRLYGLDPATGEIVYDLNNIQTPYNFQSASAGGGHLLFPTGNTITAWAPCAPPGGYQLDGWGGVHPYCSAPDVTVLEGYWPNWDIARSIVQRKDHASGYVLDGWGGIHEFAAGVANPTNWPNETHAYWAGWDIARGIVLDPCGSGNSGYVLDGWGGIHPFGGAPAVNGGPYWPGWDIAHGFVINPSCPGGVRSGYVLDGWGGVHGFGGAADPVQSGYWPNWDIARGIVSTGDGGGYVLDGFGGIHNFGSETHAVADAGHAYWPDWDIARGIVSTGTGRGYTMDGWGGIHEFGGAPIPTGFSYWENWDIANGASH